MPRITTRSLEGRSSTLANAVAVAGAGAGRKAAAREVRATSKLKNCENVNNGIDAKNTSVAAKRNALGEITNEKQTLKHQVKKGLSVIVNRKSSATLLSDPVKLQKPLPVVTAKKSQVLLHDDVAAVKDPPVKPTRKHRPRNRAHPSLVTGSTSLEISKGEDSSSFNSSSQKSLQSSQDALGFSGSRSSCLATNTDSDDDNYVSAEETTTSVPRFRYQPPPRILPPSGVEDFDLQNWEDPSQCSEYAQDIFEYYKIREAQFRCPDYLSSQIDITETMRSILVDWLVEVQESFELNHETLYTAVKMVDLYLSRTPVPKEDLQLVGAVACLISCKLDERIPPSLDDFVYVCDDAYTRHDIVEREIQMISTIDYDLGFPLSYRFLRRYGRVCRVSMPVLTLARYVLEMSLMEYKFNVELSESLLAASCLVLAMKVKGFEGWVDSLKFYSDYSPADVFPLVRALLRMMRREPRDHVKTIRQKYSHKVFHEVALCPFPSTIELTDRG